MTKNVVDTIINYANANSTEITFIPSRRQIDIPRGYVNNWSTQEFTKYVRSKSKFIVIERDHGGPGQGTYPDDGFESLKIDSENFDIIHIDPWKQYPDYKEGLEKTIDLINYSYSINKNLYFEIGTEESIRPFEVSEIDNLINDLKLRLDNDVYQRIKYVVIQCGTKLLEKENIGSFDKEKLSAMLETVKSHNLIAKEHNGDWVSNSVIKEKKDLGLTCINIAPEFGEIETKVLYNYIKTNIEWFDRFYKICLESGKWKKWVSSTFDPETNKEMLIYICGHYVLSYSKFEELKTEVVNKFPFIDNEIKTAITNKLNELYSV